MTEVLLAQRPIVMGILNVTVDSFSDGGAFLEVSAALAHAREMVASGADIALLDARSNSLVRNDSTLAACLCANCCGAAPDSGRADMRASVASC